MYQCFNAKFKLDACIPICCVCLKLYLFCRIIEITCLAFSTIAYSFDYYPLGSSTLLYLLAYVVLVFNIMYNWPFYSCVLSYLAMNASEAGGDLVLIQTSLLFSCKCQLVSIRTT